MAKESESELDAAAKADLAKLSEAVRRRYEQLALDRGLIAKSRQVIRDTERRLGKLSEPEDGDDAKGESN